MHSNRTRVVLALALAAAGVAQAADDAAVKSDKISDYLVDLGPGPVSAADLIGVSASSVTNVQALKDFNVLLTPGSTGSDKTGFGLELTPARSSLFPQMISAAQYVDKAHPIDRVLGSLSLSYAQNTHTLSDLDYRQTSAAIHAGYYINPDNDPIVAAHSAFAHCVDAQAIGVLEAQGLLSVVSVWRATHQNAVPTKEELDQLSKDYAKSDAFVKMVSDANTAAKTCVAQAAKTKWNAGQVSVTYGAAWIKPVSGGGSQLSLGRTLSLAGVVPLGDSAVLNLAWRNMRRELDLSTIAATPGYSQGNLVGGRITWRGDASRGDTFALVEVSNAKSNSDTLANTAFKAALGLDHRIADGVWLEFRFGRSRSESGDKETTKGLLDVTWSPTSTLPKLFAPAG